MVTVYSKDYCPYCDRAKALLREIWVEFTEIDITNDSLAFEELKEKSHLMTVPQIFLDNELLGGYTDIAKLHEQWLLEAKLEWHSSKK